MIRLFPTTRVFFAKESPSPNKFPLHSFLLTRGRSLFLARGALGRFPFFESAGLKDGLFFFSPPEVFSYL